MANVDLVNEIQPQHPFRPVKTRLADLRAAISDADTEGAVPESDLNKMNYNDLVATARFFDIELPIQLEPAPEPEPDPEA